MKIIQSELLKNIPQVIHAFGTAEEPLPLSLVPQWDAIGPVWKQVHGDSIAQVQFRKQQCGDVDGLYTATLGLPIGIKTADCTPILLAHESGRKVAAVHAGWRGTYAEILKKLGDRLKAEGELASEWVAAIGPTIGPCCYEVSEDLAENFRVRFPEMQATHLFPRPRYLNLPAVNAYQLNSIGITRVDILGYCTYCSTTTTKEPRFYSYRRETHMPSQQSGRQWSLIQRAQ